MRKTTITPPPPHTVHHGLHILPDRFIKQCTMVTIQPGFCIIVLPLRGKVCVLIESVCTYQF